MVCIPGIEVVSVVPIIDRAEFWRDAEAASRLMNREHAYDFIKSLCVRRALTEHAGALDSAETWEGIRATRDQLFEECVAMGLCLKEKY